VTIIVQQRGNSVMVSLIPALTSAPKQSYLGEKELYSRDKNVPLSNLLPDCTTKCLVFLSSLWTVAEGIRVRIYWSYLGLRWNGVIEIKASGFDLYPRLPAVASPHRGLSSLPVWRKEQLQCACQPPAWQRCWRGGSELCAR